MQNIFDASLGLGTIQSMSIQREREMIMEKWDRTGLLENLDGRMKENVAQLYENTMSYILNESTASETAGSFETIAFPLIRRTFTKLLANDIVTVQSLNYTIGKLFFYRPLISNRDADGHHMAMQGAYANVPNWSATTSANSQNTFGVNQPSGIPNYETNLSLGPTLYDQYYATNYADFGESLFDRSRSNYTLRVTPLSNGTITTSSQFVDCRITGFSNTSQAGRIVGPNGVDIDTETFLGSLIVTCDTSLSGTELTTAVPAGTPVLWYLKNPRYGAQLVNPATGTIDIVLDLRTPVANGYAPFPQVTGGTVSAITQFSAVWREYLPNEGDAEMAEVTFDLDPVDVAVGPARKMRAHWTPELAMDVQRFQNIDAEAELTNLLSETIANEIDTEILRDLTKVATWSSRWDYRGPARTGANTFFGTQKDWNQTLIELVNYIDAQIYKATMDGGANFLVVSPEVTALFRNMEYFHIANAATEETKYNMGIERVGNLANRYTVYQNVKFPAGLILIGRMGDSPMKSGYVYCPYQPITLTPVMPDFRNFTNVRGIMTRYGKKLISARYYGKIVIDGLPTFGVSDLR